MTVEFDIDMVNHRKYEDVTSFELQEVFGLDLIENERSLPIELIITSFGKKDAYLITPRMLATLKIKE